MLREYLSEAVSLLTEAVLGAPVEAQAACWHTGAACEDPCNSCGAEKRAFRYWDCCSSGHCYCGSIWFCEYC
jgi:hypothetical protein